MLEIVSLLVLEKLVGGHRDSHAGPRSATYQYPLTAECRWRQGRSEMSLGERLPDESTLINQNHATTLFWVVLFGFLGAFFLFLL